MKGRDYKIEEKRKRKGEARLGTKFGEQYLRINLLWQNPRTSFSSKTSCVFLSLSIKSNGWSPNSQKPKFPIQSLQIFCFWLTRSAYPIFLGLGPKLRPYIYIYIYKLKHNINCCYTLIKPHQRLRHYFFSFQFSYNCF